MSIMGDLEKDILKTDMDKDTLRAFIGVTMNALAQKMNSFEEGIRMIQTLEAETANLRRIAESKKKSEGSYGQDSTLFKISYCKDGSKTFVPLRPTLEELQEARKVKEAMVKMTRNHSCLSG